MKKTTWAEWWQSRRYDVAAISLIVLFFLVFFWPVLSSGKYFVTSDGFVYSYPLRTVAWASIRSGHIPFWTPLILSGYPLFSMAQIGIGYPLTWGYLFLPGRVAEEIYTLAPYIFFPAFTYAYAREIGRSRLAALLAAFAFGYAGAMISAVAYNGMLTNAIMWLPLMLIALERAARKESFAYCLLGATAAYAMSVLTGIGQGFLITGMVAFAYALFLAVVPVAYTNEKAGIGTARWDRWRPLVVATGALVLAGGVAAFQILETLVAQRLSIRNSLTFATFTEGSYSPWGLVQSFAAPLHYIVDASAYVVPLALVLAMAGIFSRRNSERDPRIWFWTALALASVILMLGQHTFVYRVLYQVPVFNYFRVPGRHAFEWTFAISILAAYGWDAVARRLSQVDQEKTIFSRRRLIIALILLAASIAVIIFWRYDLARIPTTSEDLFYVRSRYPVMHYLGWKVLLSVFTIGLFWITWRVASRQWRVGLLLSVILVACYAEPSVKATRWWWPTLKTADRFDSASPTTRFLKDYPAEKYRVYTRSVLFSEDLVPQRRLEPINMTMLHGLHNVAGYEPLILQRYSRALGDVFLDGVTPRPDYPVDNSILESRSHVLDLLNTGFVVTYSGMSVEPTKLVEQGGIKFGPNYPNVTLKPGEKIELPAVAAQADQLGLVTTLSFSAGLPDGTVIAKVRVFTADGRKIEREVLAGRDTAEWAHERSDVRSQVRHRLAPIFDSHPTGEQGEEFTYYRYYTRIPLDERVQIVRAEIENVSPVAFITIWKASYYDSLDHFSMPLPHYDLQKWQAVYDYDDVTILRNRNVLPRLWLVAEAEAVDAEQALQRIRGEGERPFDPKRTALMEVAPDKLPSLPGGAVSANSSARFVSYENDRLVIETTADTATVLVLSEIDYPGWVATIDGVVTPIYATDYLLRGIALPAGQHRVELHYAAPAARTGAIISSITLLLLAGIAIYARQASATRRTLFR
jgi:Bacterial membrane protein YfhO